MNKESFEWDTVKDIENQLKHGVSFKDAQYAFKDPNRIFVIDENHSDVEIRYFCFGKVFDNVMTVRFTIRKSVFRIIGAGFWRKGKKIYEEKNKIY